MSPVPTPLIATHPISILVDLLRPRLDFSAVAWLEHALEGLVDPFDARSFRAEFSRAGRRLGSHPVLPTVEELGVLREIGLWPFSGWCADECGRAALLLQALDVAAPSAHVPLVEALFQHGTIRERQAILRILAWLPDPERFAAVAAAGSRSLVPSVFEAIALANPYPARYLPPAAFDNLVLRAVVLRATPERILGLADRVSVERGHPALLPRFVGAAAV
jgi:hypothetical protein